MRISSIFVGLACCLAINSVQAQTDSLGFKEIRPILQSNNCFSCHQVDFKILGPSYKDIAKKYNDNPTNAEYLAKQIRQGSRGGVWGKLPMPASRKITDEEIAIIVEWLMAGATE